MKIVKRIGIFLAVILFLVIFSNPIYQYATLRTLQHAVVKDKQVYTQSDKKKGVDSTYLIFTDQGVLRNDDSLWHLKYDSSDYYGLIDVGKPYHIRIYGWRIPILSMYPNIVKVTPANTPAQ